MIGNDELERMRKEEGRNPRLFQDNITMLAWNKRQN
jgi:hypothetical protein